MGKCLKVRKGDGIRIGDDVLVEINQGSPHLFIACPDGMRIELIKRENRFERPAKKKHNILPPAAMVLVAAVFLGGGCSDPAARASSNGSVGGEAVSRPALSPHVSTSGSLSFYGDETGRLERHYHDRLRMIESTPWPASEDPRDLEPVDIPMLPELTPGVRIIVVPGDCDCGEVTL